MFFQQLINPLKMLLVVYKCSSIYPISLKYFSIFWTLDKKKVLGIRSYSVIQTHCPKKVKKNWEKENLQNKVQIKNGLKRFLVFLLILLEVKYRKTLNPTFDNFCNNFWGIRIVVLLTISNLIANQNELWSFTKTKNELWSIKNVVSQRSYAGNLRREFRSDSRDPDLWRRHCRFHQIEIPPIRKTTATASLEATGITPLRATVVPSRLSPFPAKRISVHAIDIAGVLLGLGGIWHSQPYRDLTVDAPPSDKPVVYQVRCKGKAWIKIWL